MNLRDLRYLVAVADHKHFGKAASVCHVSQPTLSQQLKKLESYLDAQLIERDSRKVLLTPLGAEIAHRARRIVLEADGLVELARSASDPTRGDFRLGAFPTLAPYYLPRALPQLRHKLPHLRMFLVEEKTPVLVEQLISGELDAALLALPVLHEQLDVIPLFDEHFLLAVERKHPLARRKQVRQDDLEGQALLLLEDGHCLRDQALAVCTRTGAAENREFRASSLETLRQMVAGGIGITLMPAMAVPDSDAHVRYLPFAEPAPNRAIGLAFRRSSPRRATIQRLVQELRALAKAASASTGSARHED